MASNSNPADRDARTRLRRLLGGDGPLFFGSLAFAVAAVVVYFIVIALGVRG